jgi:hypothetical protein
MPSLRGMIRRVVGVAVALLVVGGLGLALSSGSGRPSYSSVEALGHDISAHSIGCLRLYSAYQAGGRRAGVDAATCLVGSASITLYIYEDVSLRVSLRGQLVGEPTARSWVVGPNWWVWTTSRPAATAVAWATGGDLIP